MPEIDFPQYYIPLCYTCRRAAATSVHLLKKRSNYSLIVAPGKTNVIRKAVQMKNTSSHSAYAKTKL